MIIFSQCDNSVSISVGVPQYAIYYLLLMTKSTWASACCCSICAHRESVKVMATPLVWRSKLVVSLLLLKDASTDRQG